ncbi:MAG: molecular chaperone TorD family protein [Candidatus Brocadiaceae bacterium]|nr:molecular chaperone TorD family protein [Candidatus Brocadiaceae bacterium]
MVVEGVDFQKAGSIGDVEKLLVRSSLYQVQSACYLYPEGEKLSLLKSEGFLDLIQNPEKIESCYGNSADVSELLRCLKNLHEEYVKIDVDALQSIYNRIVGHTMSKDCPFYEGQYTPAHVHQQVQELADIQAFYRAFGLDISDEEKERSDHISVELEFMQFLLYKQAYAMENHGKEEAKVCLDSLKKFLKEHPGKWIPLLAILLGRKAGRGFYFAVSELTKVFMKLELTLLGVKTEMLKESDINQDAVAGAPEECLSCAGIDDMGPE